jgi:formate dehydrogenase subunit delta
VSTESANRLVYMANQIGKFFVTQGDSEAVEGTADHIRKFWDPRMRTMILDYVAKGGEGLDPVARKAVDQLRSMD